MLEAPLGAVDRYAPFRWHAPRPGATFEVRVFYDTDAKQPGGSGVFFLRTAIGKLAGK